MAVDSGVDMSNEFIDLRLIFKENGFLTESFNMNNKCNNNGKQKTY